MRARIHGGATEVGGSCLELESEGCRLVVDLGLPLNPGDGYEPALPAITGLVTPDDSLAGVLVSHAHPDHYGLLGLAGDHVPVYIGQAGARILEESKFFGASRWAPGEVAGNLADGVAVAIGAFRVTPRLVDHSAFEAHAFEIESGGRRLFYSGDLRAHGRKRGTFTRLITDPPRSIDALVLEGTRLGRTDASAQATERDVEDELASLAVETGGLLLAAYSPQNVDRVVSVYRAAIRSGRDLIIDPYTAAIAEATGNTSIPRSGWDRVRVYVPQSQRLRIKRARAFERVNRLGASRIHEPEIAEHPDRYVLTFRGSMARDFHTETMREARAVWSMWPGYLERERSAELLEFLVDHAIPMTTVHASGHATVADLRRLAYAIRPRRVIPLHTSAPERYGEIYNRVEPHGNGEWWQV